MIDLGHANDEALDVDHPTDEEVVEHMIECAQEAEIEAQIKEFARASACGDVEDVEWHPTLRA